MKVKTFKNLQKLRPRSHFEIQNGPQRFLRKYAESKGLKLWIKDFMLAIYAQQFCWNILLYSLFIYDLLIAGKNGKFVIMCLIENDINSHALGRDSWFPFSLKNF